jgi:hypothetical protein
MAGDLWLWLIEDFDEETDTNFAASHEIEQSQPRLIGERQEDRFQFLSGFTLIFTFAPISGAHFNPVVTLADAFEQTLPWRRVQGYIVAQIFGALGGESGDAGARLHQHVLRYPAHRPCALHRRAMRPAH